MGGEMVDWNFQGYGDVYHTPKSEGAKMIRWWDYEEDKIWYEPSEDGPEEEFPVLGLFMDEDNFEWVLTA